MLNIGYETISTDEDDGTDLSSHTTKSSSFLSLLTFWWMNNLFGIGSKRPLNQSDFLPLQEENRTRDLTERLQKEWNNHVKDCNNTEGQQPKLWRCVLKMISVNEAIFAMTSWLMESIFRVSQPLVLGLLLRLLSSTEKDRILIYVCCFLLALTGLSCTSTHYPIHRFELFGMRLSSAIRGLVYLKIPLLSQQLLRETTTGHIIDLVSTDVQRIEQAPLKILALVIGCFDFIAGISLVIYLIGWQVLMGVLFLTVLIPCVMMISSACARLREKTAEVTDRRLSLINELVSGIRALKAHAWENYYMEKVQKVRRSEIRILLKKGFLLSIIESLLSSSTVATFISVLTLVLTGKVLSPSIAFVILSFMNILRSALYIKIGKGVPLLFELFVSFQRIERFLQLNSMPLDCLDYKQSSCGRENAEIVVREPSTKNKLAIQRNIPKNQDTVNIVTVNENIEKYKLRDANLSVFNLTCKLDNMNGEQYLLRDVTFVASEKSLTAITGAVGSGKSTLLAAIAGEAIKSSGSIVCSGTKAYVPQTAWIFSGTIRENVLFGEHYDKKKYAEVMAACALEEDISRFPNGDFSFVGEHGVVLSGGQRARINLARAVYADADVYLLDDPLCAVDAKVGEHIFNQCICRFLEEKIRILVTYTEKYMMLADQVVALHKGSVIGKGSLYELQESGKIDTVIDASVRTLGTKQDNKTAYTNCISVSDSFVDEQLGISEEEKSTGSISSALYWDYFKAGMHPFAIIVVIVLFLFGQVAIVFPDVWLSYLTKKSWKQQQDASYWRVYGSLVFAALIFAAIRAFIFFHVSLRSAENLHNQMVNCLLKARVLFFDTNPAGRVLNRFSKDMGCLDELLPKMFLSVIQLFLLMLAAAALPVFTNFWLCFVSVPVIIVFVRLAFHYLKTSRELKKWESICRSPVFSLFSETVKGLDTIRTRRKERDFIDQFYRHQDVHNQVFYMVVASTRWLGTRADFLCSVFVTAVALLSVTVSHDPALTGLAIAYVIETTQISQYAVKYFSEIENLMTSVERVMAYSSLDSEPGYKIKKLPPINWPRDGHVSFKHVTLRYYPGGPQVLRDLTFDIQGKLKLGIVGRTGDGKSSIAAALLRMPEAEGDVFIDDVPINSIELQESRKCISVLSQSPVLFSGSLRKNLDPLEKYRDDELWNVLEEVKLHDLVKNLEGQLDYELLERGENLSVGERQLICLARTLLQQNKIVILDEPTAHVDPNTEKTIWTTVQEKLKHSTVITIAHRLNTVKDCDVILVLREGQVAALDTFATLIAREDGSLL